VTREDTAADGQWTAVRDWLAGGGPYAEPPKRVETHGALLFLFPDRVFKLKKPIAFDWMDFSTLARREAACRNEIRLNRRTAPQIYCRTAAVIEQDGGFALADEGEAVEWLVEMRRFDEGLRFDRLLAAGTLDPALMPALAEQVQALHAGAEVFGDHGGYANMAWTVQGNLEDLQPFHPDLGDALARETETLTEAALASARSLLERRRERGLVRQCHGDLHLANIVLWEERPLLFDCIEFNDNFARIDLLYDLAFLLMDLDEKGRRDLANAVLNRYLECQREETRDLQLAGLSLLPLFLSVRAAVRSKVNAFQAEIEREKMEAARHYLRAARGYLDPAAPGLYAVGGLSGSGKSTLARGLAPALGAAPGALVLRSDQIRKQLYGVGETERLPKGAYSEAWHNRVAEEMLRRARLALTGGHSVVLDTVNNRAEGRARIADMAHRLGVPFAGLWLEAPLEVLQARVAARSGDASDATPEIVRLQKKSLKRPQDWSEVDASQSPEAVLAEAKAKLGLAG